MTETTQNYMLVKPTPDEKVSVLVLNQNMDIIDSNLKLFSNDIKEIKSNIPSIKGLISQTELDNILLKYAKKSDVPVEYDDTILSNRIRAIEDDYLNLSDKTELISAINTAKTDAINRILGESVDVDFDTLQEVADWIKSDTTNSSKLISRVSILETSLETKAEISNIPTKVSQLLNDIGYITASDIDTTHNHDHENMDVLNKLTQTILDKIDGIENEANVNVQSDWDAISGDSFIKNKPKLSKIATTGSYEDLENKPNIPTKMSELSNDVGFKTIDNNTTYRLSKIGSTITLLGSDNTSSTVTVEESTDANVSLFYQTLEPIAVGVTVWIGGE